MLSDVLSPYQVPSNFFTRLGDFLSLNYDFLIKSVLLKVRPPNCIIPGSQFVIQVNQDTTHLTLNATQGHKRRLSI